MGHKIMEGWIPTPGHEEEDVFKSLSESQGFCEFGDIEGIRDTGKGKLSLTYKAALTLSGEQLFAKEAQSGPDCTSHAVRNAWDIARANDIMLGEPEEWSARGATEVAYGMRGHSGGGMNVGRAVRFFNEYGNLIRKAYDSVDLSHYDFNIGNRWGKQGGVPQFIKDLAAKFPAAYFYRIRKVEEARDALASGYGVLCGSRFGSRSGVRDKNGYLRWDGSWNHAMAWVGCDARVNCDPIVAQSWGDYGRGGHPDFELPKGCFLIHAEDAQRMIDTGECYMLGKVKGIPARDLPNYGASEFL